MKKDSTNQARGISGSALIKGAILLIFVIVAVCLSQTTQVRDFFTQDTLGHLLETWGFWAPLIFILIHALTICMFAPASILTVLGAAVFGAYWGFLYAWIGAILGACGSFFIGRTLGRNLVASLLGDRLRKYDDAIERNGFTTVFYLRLMNLPFSPVNYGMGLTKVGFRDYFFGTSLGVIMGIFVLTFLGSTLKEMWISGSWEDLISMKVFFPAVLLVFAFFVHLDIKKIQKNKNFFIFFY
ncbi:MAG: TVP38/TMEM64 family protein [Desulfobacterales bacterium]|nr:TVP38/TMEM64 family protein [Desulfobacterales bacterium]